MQPAFVQSREWLKNKMLSDIFSETPILWRKNNAMNFVFSFNSNVSRELLSCIDHGGTEAIH